jgi:hypothetical protein
MILFSIIDKNGDAETLKTSRTKLTVGGAHTDDIILPDGEISPEHGVFHIEGNEVVYTDNGYGTLVNDREVLGESIPVSPGDSIVIGPVVLTYTQEDENIVPNQYIPAFKSDIIKVNRDNYTKPIHDAPGSYFNPQMLPAHTRSPAGSTPSGMSSPPENTHSQLSEMPVEETYVYHSHSRPKKDNPSHPKKGDLKNFQKIEVNEQTNPFVDMRVIIFMIIILLYHLLEYFIYTFQNIFEEFFDILF